MKNVLSGTLMMLVLIAGPVPAAADGEALLRERCADCHQLDEPGAMDAGTRLQRVAPPLHFAGNKFRREWLVEWLQAPDRLRPAGYLPAAHVTTTEEGDVVRKEDLAPHMALSASDAELAADHLMDLTARQSLIDADGYETGSVALRMGMMDFRRFKGCDACHQDAPDSGGVSGPRLYDAWQRLQPAFISSFIANPAGWDSVTLMPVPPMNEAAVHKLVDYLHTIGGDDS